VTVDELRIFLIFFSEIKEKFYNLARTYPIIFPSAFSATWRRLGQLK